jgi:hypothetical protein
MPIKAEILAYSSPSPHLIRLGVRPLIFFGGAAIILLLSIRSRLRCVSETDWNSTSTDIDFHQRPLLAYSVEKVVQKINYPCSAA